jgi:hypothetical protein
MKYQVGQQVWRASWEGTETSIPCPDCGGTGRIRVTFHDETQVSIGCQYCARGYDPPTGRVRVHDRRPTAVLETITGAEIEGGKTEWRTNRTYRAPESDLFDNEAECLAAAAVKAAQHDREERDQINNKEKDTRTWAWNASYHRKCIKDAQKQIDYHSRKLAVASIKAKEARATETA